MSWIDPSCGNGEKILHLRLTKGDRWMPYTAPQFSQLRQGQADVAFMGVRPSKGFRLAQHLLSQGWTYVPSGTTVPVDAPCEVAARIANAQTFGLVERGR